MSERQVRRMFVRNTRMLFVFLCFIIHNLLLIPHSAEAEINDKVIAFVDDEAITMSELKEQFSITAAVSHGITIHDVLNTMINRLLLLREARKFRIEAPTREGVLNEYIDLKLRAFIRVSDTDVETYYRENISNFTGKEYEDVRDEIERYLMEKELNDRLREFLNTLYHKAHIKIYLDAE